MRKKIVLCPYCGQRARFWYDSSPIFGENRGPHYHCDPCQAYVGCHRAHGGKVPLGTLARFELRRERIAAHHAFDPLWRTGYLTRDGAYAVLADRMGLEAARCHIAMMDEEQCREVVRVCRQITSDRLKQALDKAKFNPQAPLT